jgi:hypothetical protein
MFFIWIMTFVVVFACVVLHYEMLNFISKLLPKLPIPRRRRVSVAMLGLIITHIIEIFLFATAMYVVEVNSEEGGLIGHASIAAAERAMAADEAIFGDAVYLSFTTFTSLGYGDVVPVGDMRILAAVEVLTGLLTIAWSASFIYMQMTDLWSENPEKRL